MPRGGSRYCSNSRVISRRPKPPIVERTGGGTLLPPLTLECCSANAEIWWELRRRFVARMSEVMAPARSTSACCSSTGAISPARRTRTVAPTFVARPQVPSVLASCTSRPATWPLRRLPIVGQMSWGILLPRPISDSCSNSRVISRAPRRPYRRADQREDAVGAFHVAQLLEQRGDLAGAEAAFARADRRGHAGAASDYGVLLGERGDLAGAEAAFRRADERGDSAGAFNLGVVLEAKGDLGWGGSRVPSR